MSNEPPKTADGVEIVVGMTVWLYCLDRKKLVSRTVDAVRPEGWVFTDKSNYSANPRDLYASKARAEQELKLHVGD